MNAITIAKCIESCDERISSVKSKLSSMNVFSVALGLVNLEMESKYKEEIHNYENNIKLIQVEKIIYNALLKNNNKTVFKKLLAKYDELMGISYDFSGNMVLSGINKEFEHLDYCKESLNQREYIKKLCFYGENK